jgi:alpha-glucosidase (family GH31 glycosyl hydrolase)
MKHYHFESKPIASQNAIVSGPHYRFTILTDRLIRYEWSHDGKFEDRASTFAINRELSVPKFQVVDRSDELEIINEHFHLSYDKKRFSPSGLLCSFSSKITLWGAQWRYGLEAIHGSRENLGGTARTLDEVDGRCDMGHGVLSTFGYAALDDSMSMLFDGEGFVAGRRPGDRIDGYLFCHGHSYKDAIRDFYKVSGKQPVLPRWALGNWWSRYYSEYSPGPGSN